MKILAVNAGSSSLKFQVYEMPEEKVLASGVFERIGLPNGIYTIKVNGEKVKKETLLENHEIAVHILVEELINYKIVDSLEEIEAVGHRVVHGGDKYSESVVLTDEVLDTVEKLSTLAPLHNPANLTGIRAFKHQIPNALSVGCFDTAFHQTMEKDKFLYAIPNKYYDEYKIRKYGFHGMSHKYVANEVNKYLNKENAKVIICHLGNGASLSAVENGKCIDTTMGFTPNAGVIMGSRSGDIDYSIIPYIMEMEDLTISEVDTILNKQSGMLGLTEFSTDFRDIQAKYEENDEKTIIAVKKYISSVAGYIAKYFVELGGADAICFTAGVGENSRFVRRLLLKKLACLGIYIDEELNNKTRLGEEGIISTKESSIPCIVIPTDEEVMIARDTYKLKNRVQCQIVLVEPKTSDLNLQ